jgi:flavin reductase (DIM6/NTAB) family NADH-FMN oxidoreductase RutF
MNDGASLDGAMAALGRVPSGLFIVTARYGRNETGMLGSWVQQCSFDPPQITTAFAKDRWLLDWLTEGAPFAINVLGEGQKQLIAHFGKGFDRGEKAFEGIEVSRNGESAPVLAAAHAFLDCRVVRQVPAGDHVLVLGRIVGGGILHDARPATHVRRSGKHY